MCIRRLASLTSTTLLLIVLATSANSEPPKPLLDEGRQLHKQAMDLYEQGRYREALPIAKRALGLREKTLPPDHIDIADSLSNLANLYFETGADRLAGPLYQRALAITEKAVGPEHPQTAWRLENLGFHYIHIGSYAQAIPFFQRSIRIFEKVLGPEHAETASATSGLSLVYSAIGDWSQAEPLYQRTLSIREKALGPEHPATARTLHNFAELYYLTGAYAQAESLLLRALAIREKVRGADHLDTADSLDSLALVYILTGDYARAEPIEQRALAIREKSLGPLHPKIANSLNNLASIRQGIGAYTQAEPLQKRAVEMQLKLSGPNHPNAAAYLHNLGELYRAVGAYAEAKSLLQRTLTVKEKALGFDNRTTIDTVVTLAAAHWADGESSRALALFQRAQSSQAKNLERFLLLNSEARKREYLQAVAQDTFKYVAFSTVAPSRSSIALGLTSVLQYKGRALDAMSDGITRLRRSTRAQDRSLLDELGQVANQFSALTYQGAGNLPSAEYLRRIDKLTKQQEKLETELAKRSGEFRRQVAPVTIAGVNRAIPENAALVEWFRYLPFDPAADSPKSRQIKPRYIAYVLKRNTDPAMIDMGDALELETLVRNFQQAVSDPHRGDVKTHAAALSAKLMQPLRAQLSGVKQILFAPDGALNLVPFAALSDESGNYWLQRANISYLTSGRDLLRMGGASASSASSMVVAAPNYGELQMLARTEQSSQRSADLDRGGLVFRPLINAELEAHALQALLKLDDSKLLLHGNATEARLKELHSPNILHIATHGFFLNDQELAGLTKGTALNQPLAGKLENPLLRSGLALAGANARRSGQTDDGILTAMEAAQLDLQGTALVVLSACDTGVGEVQNGEGVFGLRRALVLAGVQTQVTSLWKVPDDATRTLMVDYYRRLQNGEGRADALRRSQQSLLADPQFSHPYYWASFIPIGNWSPLPRTIER